MESGVRFSEGRSRMGGARANRKIFEPCKLRLLRDKANLTCFSATRGAGLRLRGLLPHARLNIEQQVALELEHPQGEARTRPQEIHRPGRVPAPNETLFYRVPRPSMT